MTKKSKTPFGIFTESVGLYFSNFVQFTKYMSFPVWGQILGLVVIFATTYFYNQNLPNLIEKFPNLNNPNAIILLAIIVILPGLLIYLKAFWEYLVAYGAINSMLDNMLKSGRVYDFDAHTQLVKKRSMTFVGLWLLTCIFTIAALLPIFWVLGGIFAVYFVLIFQVFTFEADKTPVGCFKRSLELVLRHFLPTFMLIAGVGALTYFVLPQILTKAFDGIGLTVLLSGAVKPLLINLPQINIPNAGTITQEQIAIWTVQLLIAQILVMYSLPLRSILFAMWYKELSQNYEPAIKKEKKSLKKRPSEKLMEESHKKYGKKKLDTNILRRAMEKEDEG